MHWLVKMAPEKSTLIKVLAESIHIFREKCFLMVSYFIRRIRMNPSRWESVLFTRNCKLAETLSVNRKYVPWESDV